MATSAKPATSTKDKKKQKLKSFAEKAAMPTKGSVSKNADAKTSKLHELEAPKSLGDACIALDLREVRSRVAIATDMLAITKSASDDKNAENSILLDFREKSSVALIYIKAGAMVTLDIDAKVFSTGSVVVDASLFRAIRGNSPYVVLTLNRKTGSVDFRCGSTRGSVQMLSTQSEYVASSPDVKIKTDVSIPKMLLLDTCTRLLFNSFDPGIPAMGLPLRISVAKSVLTVTSNDNLVGAVYSRPEKEMQDFETTIPGEVITKIAKYIESDVLKCGFSESTFRVRARGIDIIHPMVTYDLMDIQAWLAAEETHKPEFEMILPTTEFIDAVDNAMCMSSIDKSESKITIEFEESRGRVLFLGATTQSKSPFSVKKMVKSGKNMTIITNGKRIISFVNILKGFSEFRMRVRKGRAYLFSPDGSFTFLVPLN